MDRHNIFVYGTLRSRGGNNGLLRESEFISNAVTEKEYALYVEGIPYVSKDEKVSRITGEVWSVDDNTLQRIDLLEGHPSWYVRELISVMLPNLDIVKAWIYFNPNYRGRLTESGDYFNQ